MTASSSSIISGVKLGIKIRTPFIKWGFMRFSCSQKSGKLHDRSFCENECTIISTQTINNGKTFFPILYVTQLIHLKGTHYLYELRSTIDPNPYYFIHYRFNKEGSLVIYLIQPSSVQNLKKYISEHNAIPQYVLDNINSFNRKK